MIFIGIDPGTETGIGVIVGKDITLKTVKIHEAMKFIEDLVHEDRVHIRVEDARKRKWFGMNSDSKKQGAGSVKRDCTIWEDFLTDLEKQTDGLLTFEMIHPVKGSTKLDSKRFNMITGFTGRSNQHSRDALMLVFNYKPKTIK